MLDTIQHSALGSKEFKETDPQVVTEAKTSGW